MTTVIVDYQSGNLHSALKSFQRMATETDAGGVAISADPAVAFKTSGPSAIVYAPGDTVPTQKASSGLDALTARADTISASLGRITTAMELEFVRGGGLRDIRATIKAFASGE